MTYHPAGEVNLARRIAEERAAREWSAGDVQRRMQDAGCKVPRNAILRIEAGERSVKLDELIALGTAFGISVDNLLKPVELVHQERADAALGRLRDARQRLQTGLQAYAEAIIEFMVAAHAPAVDRDTLDYLRNQIEKLYDGEQFPAIEVELAFIPTDPADRDRVEQELASTFRQRIDSVDVRVTEGTGSNGKH